MYKTSKLPKTSIKVNNSYKGETIEQKVRRIVNNKEPITDGAPLIYRNRERGVEPEFDIRTDRMEIAVDVADHIAKTHIAKRKERFETRPEEIAKKAAKDAAEIAKNTQSKEGKA